MFPVCKAPGPHSKISEELLHSIFSGLWRILASWILVNPLLSMNEAWMDECAARLQPLVDQYKPIQHQTFTIEKFRDLIVTFRSCPGDKEISIKKGRIDVGIRKFEIVENGKFLSPKIECLCNNFKFSNPYIFTT